MPRKRPQRQVDFPLLPFSKPASEVISEYSRKVDFLKGMLQAEKLVSLPSRPSGLRTRTQPSSDSSSLSRVSPDLVF